MMSIRHYMNLVESALELDAARDTIKEMASPTGEMKAGRYYHGTPSESAARSILKNGLQPDQLRDGQKERSGRGFLDPVQGRVYLTPTLPYAIIYAIGGDFIGTDYFTPERLGKEGRYGYVFVIDGNDFGDVQPDEDSVGEFVSKHTETRYDKSSIPWRYLGMFFKPDGEDDDAKQRVYNNIRRAMTERQFRQAVKGEVAYQASGGKRALKALSDADKLLLIKWGAHIAHQGAIRPVECWRFDKALTKKLKKDASNFFELAKRMTIPTSRSER